MDVASALKSEILRLAKKVVRQNISPLRSGIAAQRKQIAQLKQQVASLEKQIKQLASREPKKSTVDNADIVVGRTPRFTPEMVKKDRARLGISQSQYGMLIGISAQSVYSYESGGTTPRRDTLSAIAALRKIGKREALDRLNAGLPQKS